MFWHRVWVMVGGTKVSHNYYSEDEIVKATDLAAEIKRVYGKKALVLEVESIELPADLCLIGKEGGVKFAVPREFTWRLSVREGKETTIGARDLEEALSSVKCMGEFQAYDLRIQKHDDGLGAYLCMDLPLGVCVLYELRRC